jgi:hypothetical protein
MNIVMILTAAVLPAFFVAAFLYLLQRVHGVDSDRR